MRVMLLTEHHLGGFTGSSESTLTSQAVSLFLLLAYFFFERTSDAKIPNVAHVIDRPYQGVKTSNHRNMGYGSRREKTYGGCISTTKAQTSLR